MKITQKHLEAKIDYLNKVTNSPTESYIRTDSGMKAQVGNYHLDIAYGEYSLARMSNEGGGINLPIYGRYTKEELAALIDAYIAGYQANLN